MKKIYIIYILALGLCGCSSKTPKPLVDRVARSKESSLDRSYARKGMRPLLTVRDRDFVQVEKLLNQNNIPFDSIGELGSQSLNVFAPDYEKAKRILQLNAKLFLKPIVFE